MANENPIKKWLPETFPWRRALWAVALLAGVAFFYLGRQDSPILRQNGKVAPNIQFELPSGETSSLKALKGNVILLNFWAGWCEPCLQEMPSLKALEEHFAGHKFKLLAFNIEDDPEIARQNAPGIPLPKNLIYRFDRQSVSDFQVGSIPLSVLLDAEGKVQDVWVGPREWMDEDLVMEIGQLIKAPVTD